MMPPDPTLAIETRGLIRCFGKNRAVDGLDLTVYRGEMAALVGPDGAGKSTAIRLLCGILRPDAGELLVLGRNLRHKTEIEAAKARIGYLSQEFTLYGDLTIDENIEFFADLHGVTGFRRRRDELLEFTRLTPFRKRLAEALSGGMKKKLALACTLIHTPELLLLDEPSTGVDPVSRGEFWTILSGILDQQVTILMTTPYLDEAERCHRVCLLHRGRLVMAGTPAEVMEKMPGQIWEIRCADPAAACRTLRAEWPPSRLVLAGDRLRLWTPGTGAEELRRLDAMLQAAGLGPAEPVTARPTLEDAFAALTDDTQDSRKTSA
jgi:ABC-2 type transport system ATP-binding protein